VLIKARASARASNFDHMIAPVVVTVVISGDDRPQVRCYVAGMSQLEALGVHVTRTYKSSSTSVSGMELASSETTEFGLVLPKPSEVKAHFTKEGLGKKIAKLFKKELQTGDAAFDAAVFIATDTPDETAKLLASEDVRNAIALTIQTAGPIDIDHDTVRMEVAGRQDGDDAAVLALVRALI
jgi:hypothetical protein